MQQPSSFHLKFALSLLLLAQYGQSVGQQANSEERFVRMCKEFSVGQPVRQELDSFTLTGFIRGFSRDGGEAYIEWTALTGSRQYVEEWRNGQISRNVSLRCYNFKPN